MAFEQGTGGVGGFIPPTQPGPSPPPAPPPAPPSAPGPSYSPPSMPNWADVISSSPYVIAAQALAAQQLAALKSQLGANAARALVNLGDYGLAGQVGELNLPGG